MTTARDRGLGYALRIHRTIDEADWKHAIEAIADDEERQVAREYLRSIYQRRRVAEATKAARQARKQRESASGDGQG